MKNYIFYLFILSGLAAASPCNAMEDKDEIASKVAAISLDDKQEQPDYVLKEIKQLPINIKRD